MKVVHMNFDALSASSATSLTPLEVIVASHRVMPAV